MFPAGMIGSSPGLPGSVASQTAATQTLTAFVPCTLTAKLWGAGGGETGDVGGAGGYAYATFRLQPGDVVTYAAGGSARDFGDGRRYGGLSGSGLGNGGNGTGGGTGGGGARSELFINGAPALMAGGGGGRSYSALSGDKITPGGAGGGTTGQDAPNPFGWGLVPPKGGNQSGGGAGGETPGHPEWNGGSGSGGQGGNGSTASGAYGRAGGGGGGWRGGGGGSIDGSLPEFGQALGGAGGSGYDSTGSGTLAAGSGTTPGNAADTDRINGAGDPGHAGLVVLKFAF